MLYYKMPKNQKYTAAQKRAYAKRMRNRKSKPYKKRYNTGNMIISRPLLPQTQKVALRYVTRVQINPTSIESGAADTSHAITTYNLSWNNLNDIDQSSVAVASAMEGIRNHQPRMYDQYAQFYNKITAIGGKAKMTFLAQDRVVALQTKDHLGHVTGTLDTICDPLPCYVGYLNAQWADDANPTAKFDDLLEKKEIRYKKLVDQDKPQTLYAKWSLNKEPSRKYSLQLESHQMQDDWGAEFNHDLISTQMRHLHLFAHPMSTQETRSGVSGFKDPEPVDVTVEMDIICILSDRKEVQKS